MKKLYFLLLAVLVFCMVKPGLVQAQMCSSFAATYHSYESRCAATGSIQVNATGGSGSYKYKVAGTVNTNFTSTDSITGLPAGNYTLTVTDIITNCTLNFTNVIVAGTYRDPRFTLNSVDVSCDNGSNGRISLATQTFGRGPYRYSILAPSPMGIGTTNGTGTFNNLSAGVYTIRLTDSCGGIQSRLVTINNYTWKIDSVKFNKFSCDSAKGYIRVSDSRGNISTVGGIPGLLYGVVRSAGDTLWSTNPSITFYLGGLNNFEVVVKDACGKIKKFPVAVSFKPTVGASVRISSVTCNSFSASVTGVANFFGPEFCLTDSSGTELACNSTGVFDGIVFGDYCIHAHDSCSDTTIIRCFTVAAPPISVNNNVQITNKVCGSFSAAITGQVGLTNPVYCLYDSASNLITCNNSGLFDSLSYGSYCINIRDSCRDTTLQRCFTAIKPLPVVPPVITPAYTNCFNFGIAVTGDSLTNPSFCLLDSAGQVIACNTTGVFDSLLYGNYCVNVHDSCYDTTITRCLAILGPGIVNNISSQIINRYCSGFSVAVNGSNLTNPQYCLYRSDSTLLACNSTGFFDSVAYGAYYVAAHNECPDTTFYYDVSATAPEPSLSNNVSISNRTCATFSVNTSGPQNISNPQYCLYDSKDSLLACNTSSIFSNLVYGNYCIKMKDGCYDTVISRCFTAAPLPMAVSVYSQRSCAYGFAKIGVTVAGGVVPVTIKVYQPDGSLFFAGTYNSTSVLIDSLPGTVNADRYKILAIDNCGNIDSTSTGAVASVVSHVPGVIPKCPSSTWPNGSGTVVTTANSNNGSITVRIIKKNNVTLSSSLVPNSASGGVFSFNNLGPGVYIIRYRVNDGCSKYLYDTVTVSTYQYPALDRSSAYQCDQNGFSLGAVVSNGVGPFTYEIIGSTPASPSIITAPQTNPVFTINNGTTYSLVRLRALDACGNASLEDASILPLANNGIVSDFNCFQLYTTLRVDTMYNSSYAWYVKHTVDGADSTYLGNGYSIYLPNVTPSDTGLYVCHLVVNSGCIRRTYYYRLDGSCYHYLPVTLERFTAAYAGSKVFLNWTVAATADIKRFVIERKTSGTSFKAIGTINAAGMANYSFLDNQPDPGDNYYRLRIAQQDNAVRYSNVVQLAKGGTQDNILVYPNPAQDVLRVTFRKPTGHSYKIILLDALNQPVKLLDYNNLTDGDALEMRRTGNMGNGVYILKLVDLMSNETFTRKVIFR